jgi:hypothetical protein
MHTSAIVRYGLPYKNGKQTKKQIGACSAQAMRFLPYMKKSLLKSKKFFPKKGKKGKYGYVNQLGATVIPFIYDDAGAFLEGLAAVKLNNKWGFIDQTRKEIIPFIYDEIVGFDEGLARVKLNGKFGFIDKSGKEITPLKYDNVGRLFMEGLVWVEISGKFGYINKSGKEAVPVLYSIEEASEMRDAYLHDE